MKELFLSYGIDISEEKLNKFKIYFETLIEYNNKFNITAITEEKEVYEKHFIDSVLGLREIKGKNMIDIGSGGGFPAIPIKIMKEDINLTLLEATGKKCEFLKEVVNRLNLESVKVINGRAEDLAKDNNFRESFDVCTARAVARMNTLCEYCMPFVKIGGKFVAFKGEGEEETLEAASAIKILGGKLEKIEKYNLADAKRTLIVIDKIKSTEKKYPRGNGKERKNPL